MDNIEPTTIYEQLSQECNCMTTVNANDVDELIQLISSLTCWQNKPCETFLVGERKEIMDVPNCVEKCEVFEFTPFYHPFDKDSFEFTLVTQQGIEETTETITEFAYSEIDGNFKMVLPLPDCKCGCNPCECVPKYKLMVTYVAGFELLPDCLIPIMCEALQYIAEKNKCDCAQCQTCDNKYEDDKIPILVDDADSLTLQLKNYFIRTLARQYRKQLSLISLCEMPNELWGFRVCG